MKSTLSNKQTKIYFTKRKIQFSERHNISHNNNEQFTNLYIVHEAKTYIFIPNDRNHKYYNQNKVLS